MEAGQRSGTRRDCADTPRTDPAELFRSEIARRHTGGPRLSRPYPPRPAAWARDSLADGPAREGPAPTRRVPTQRNCSEVKSRGATREGRACRGRIRPVPPRGRATLSLMDRRVASAPHPHQKNTSPHRHAGCPPKKNLRLVSTEHAETQREDCGRQGENENSVRKRLNTLKRSKSNKKVKSDTRFAKFLMALT